MIDINSLFDNNFYLSTYQDVARAVARGLFSSALDHYQKFGKFENRQPSSLFNPQFYLNQNGDVKAAVDQNKITGIDHFIRFGQFEGRDPSSLFNNNFYRANNPDVATAVANKAFDNLITHYQLFGKNEGRRSSPFIDPLKKTLPDGVASGDTTATSTVLWTRSNSSGRLIFEAAKNPNFTNVERQVESFVTDPSLPVKVQLNNLTPGTQYYYRITDASGNSTQGKFETSALLGTRTGLRFGVSGDWRGELAPYPAIANADERNLDFFIMHGDTIYADYPSPDLPLAQAKTLLDYRIKNNEVYSYRYGINTWADLRSSTSLLATIDDHEVTNDFAGGALASTDSRFENSSNLINDSQLYENGLQAFQEYNPIRDEFYGQTGDSRTAFERKLYRFNTYGSDAAVIVLDNRSFRDRELDSVTNLNDPKQIAAYLARSFDIDPVTGQPTARRTMLGQAQLADLKRDLLTAQNNGITWKFITIPEPIQNLGLLGASDRYEGYAAERTEILRFIKENNISNVVFISADIHGTVVNNLTYQNAPGTAQIPTNAWEITTGSVAFDAPFGPTVIDLALDNNLITAQQKALYNSLPNEGKEQFIQQLVNGTLTPLGYDPVGLQNSPINATLLKGGYTATNSYGWTEFEIGTQQQLRVTTYGIQPYTEAELLANPSAIINRTPTVISEFLVNPV